MNNFFYDIINDTYRNRAIELRIRPEHLPPPIRVIIGAAILVVGLQLFVTFWAVICLSMITWCDCPPCNKRENKPANNDFNHYLKFIATTLGVFLGLRGLEYAMRFMGIFETQLFWIIVAMTYILKTIYFDKKQTLPVQDLVENTSSSDNDETPKPKYSLVLKSMTKYPPLPDSDSESDDLSEISDFESDDD